MPFCRVTAKSVEFVFLEFSRFFFSYVKLISIQQSKRNRVDIIKHILFCFKGSKIDWHGCQWKDSSKSHQEKKLGLRHFKRLKGFRLLKSVCIYSVFSRTNCIFYRFCKFFFLNVGKFSFAFDRTQSEFSKAGFFIEAGRYLYNCGFILKFNIQSFLCWKIVDNIQQTLSLFHICDNFVLHILKTSLSLRT